MTSPTYLSGLLFTKAHNLVRQRVYGLLEAYDLTPTLWSMLSIIIRSVEGKRSSLIAQDIGVQPPMVTMMADTLIELKLIRRVAHHTDGRVKLLVATSKGKKVAKEVENKLNGEIGYLMSGLTAHEITVFTKALNTIITNAH
jgi:DNA-binding MarR family transcriptional regulator